MTLNRSLLYTTITLLFAVLFIPLFVSNNLFFPYITGKNFAFRIIVELAALAWVILMASDKNYRPKFSWLSIAITIFVGIVAVADAFGSNPVKSFLSNFERMEGWITLAHLLVYYLILSSVLKTWTYWRSFFQVSVGVSVIVCIYGFMQLVGAAAIHQSVSRLDASFGNAAYLAIYMLFHIFITLILLSRQLKERDSTTLWYQDVLVYTYGLVIVCQTAVLFFTATRGSILGLIGGLILAAILVAITERENKLLRKISTGIIIGLVVVIGLFFLTKNTSFVKNNEVLGRIASISASDDTTKSRFMIWKMAWQGTTQDPKHFLIGWGQESFNYVFAKYYNPGMYAQEQWFDRSHDIFFDWLSQAGMLGLLAYLSILGLALYGVWRKSNLSSLEKSLVTGLLAGYFFHNLFVFDNIVSYIMFFSVLAYIHFSITEVKIELVHSQNKHQGKKEAKGQNNSEFNPSLQYTAILLAGIIFVGVFYQYDYKPIAANLALMNALTQPQVSSTTVDSFKEALSYNTIGLYETREQLIDVASKTFGSNADNSVKQAMASLAWSEIANQLKETPNDVRYYVLGGNYFQNIGDYKDAGTLLTQAEKLSPKKQSLLFILGSNYLALGQRNDALTTFKKAYELDTTDGQAKTLYGLIAFYDGQQSITDSLLGPGPIMDSRFLSAYKQTKHYDLMMAYLEKNATAKPSDIQSQIALAAGYMIIGNTSKAITTLQYIKTLTTDVGVLSQIDGMIKDIQAGKNPLSSAI